MTVRQFSTASVAVNVNFEDVFVDFVVGMLREEVYRRSASSAPVLVSSNGTPISRIWLRSTRLTVAKSTNILDNVGGNVRFEDDSLVPVVTGLFRRLLLLDGHGGQGKACVVDSDSDELPLMPINKPR